MKESLSCPVSVSGEGLKNEAAGKNEAEKKPTLKEKIKEHKLVQLKRWLNEVSNQSRLNTFVVKYNQLVSLDDAEIISRINDFNEAEDKINVSSYFVLLKLAEERGLIEAEDKN